MTDKLSRFGDLKGIPFTISPNWLHEEISGLTKIERLVLANLCRRASGQDKISFPSTGRIALDTDSTKPSIIKAIKSLVEKGCLTKEQRFGEDGKQMSNIYAVNFQWNPPQVVVKKLKSKRGSYKRDKDDNDGGKVSLPCKMSLPTPVKCLNSPSKMSLPEVIPSISNTQSLSSTTDSQSGSSNLPVQIPEDFKELTLFLQGGRCYHSKWTPKLFKDFETIKKEWERNCPLVNIKNEISKAHTWCMTGGKTKKNLAVFLTGWMNRSQQFLERGSSSEQKTFFGQKNSRVLETSEEFQKELRERS